MGDLLALLLMGVVVFSVYGFLATYEPPGNPGMRVLYAWIGLASAAYIVRVALGKWRRPADG